MADLTFEEIVKAAQKLTPTQKALLIKMQIDELRLFTPKNAEESSAKREALRAMGAFDNVESLYGKYASLPVDVSFEELNDYLIQVGKAWEEELDDLKPDNI